MISTAAAGASRNVPAWRQHQLRIVAIASAGIVIALVTFVYRYVTFVGFRNDHFVHLSMAQQMTLGAMPVRDYVERGLPLMSAVSAVGQVVFGPGLQAELVVVALAFATAAVLSLVTGTLVSGSIGIGTAAALVTVLAYPVSYAYPKILVYAAAFAAAWAYAVRPSIARLVLVAGSVAIAFLFRHDHGVLLAAGVFVLFVARHGISPGAIRPVAICGIAIAALTAPYLLWIQAHEGLSTYVADGIAFSRREAERSTWWEFPTLTIDRSKPLFVPIGEGPIVNVRWAPAISDDDIVAGERRHDVKRRDPVGPRTWQYELTSWSRSSLERLVRDPAVADTHGIDRGKFVLDVPAPRGIAALVVGWHAPGEGLRPRQNGVTGLFYAAWLLPVAAASLLIASWRRAAPATRPFVLMAIAVQLAMNLTMLRDPLDLRIRDVVAPVAMLLAFVAGGLWQVAGGVASRVAAKASAVAVLLIVAGAAAGAGPVQEHLDEMQAVDGWQGLSSRIAELRQEFTPPHERTGRISPAHERVVRYIQTCTPADARILTMTFAPELFFYSGHGFAAGQVALTPGYFVNERHASLMLQRLASEKVPLVIVDSETRDELAANYPRVVEYVEKRYQEFGRVSIGAGKDWILLAESARPAGGTFGDARWPCWATTQQRDIETTQG